jgi:hypothetical protein
MRNKIKSMKIEIENFEKILKNKVLENNNLDTENIQLRKIKEEYNTLKKLHDNLFEDRKNLGNKLNLTEEELIKENNKYNQTINNYKEQINILNQQNKQKDEKINNLEEKNINLNKMNIDNSNKLNEYQLLNSKNDLTIKNLENLNNQLELKLKEEELVMCENENNFNGLISEANHLKLIVEDLEKIQTEKDLLQSKYNNLQNDFNTTTKNLNEKIKLFEEKDKEYQLIISNNIASINKFQNIINENNKNNINNTNEISKLQLYIIDLKKENEELKKINLKLEDSINSIMESFKNYKIKNEEEKRIINEKYLSETKILSEDLHNWKNKLFSLEVENSQTNMKFNNKNNNNNINNNVNIIITEDENFDKISEINSVREFENNFNFSSKSLNESFYGNYDSIKSKKEAITRIKNLEGKIKFYKGQIDNFTKNRDEDKIGVKGKNIKRYKYNNIIYNI